MCFLHHQSAVAWQLVYQVEEGKVWRGRGQPLPTTSCLSWRRSSTSALTCVVLGGWKWLLGSSSLIVRLRSGFKTAGWGTRRNRSMERWQVYLSWPPATCPPAQPPLQTTWIFQMQTLLELPPPQTCTSLYLALSATAIVVSIFSHQTWPIWTAYFHLLQMVHRPPLRA